MKKWPPVYASGALSRRCDGDALRRDVQVACALMPTNEAVGAISRRFDGEVLNVPSSVRLCLDANQGGRRRYLLPY